MPSVKLLPHGSYALIPAMLTTMAWLAALFQDGCDFGRLSDSNSNGILAQLASSDTTPWLEVGFAAYREPVYDTVTQSWQVLYTGECIAYPPSVVDPNNDTVWKITKGFTFISLVLGGSSTFFLWFSTCCIFSRATWRLAGCEVFFALLFQALAFLWFRNDMCTAAQCYLFRGSQADVIACVLWAIAAALIFCHYPRPRDFSDRDGIMLTTNNHGGNNNNRAAVSSQPSISISEGAIGEGPAVMSEGSSQKSNADEDVHSGSASRNGTDENEII